MYNSACSRCAWHLFNEDGKCQAGRCVQNNLNFRSAPFINSLTMASKINDIIIRYKGLLVTDYPPNLENVVRVGYAEDFFFSPRKIRDCDNVVLNIHILYKMTEYLLEKISTVGPTMISETLI